MALQNVLGDLALDATLADVLEALVKRYGGGKTPYAARLTTDAAITPASGKAIRLFWASALQAKGNDPTNRVTIAFQDGVTCYTGENFAHWEVYEGAANKQLQIDVTNTNPVDVNLTYQEFTP